MSPLLLQLHYVAAAAAKAPAACTKPTFFGLVPWYQYLKLNPPTDATNPCGVANFQALGVNATNGSSTSGFLLVGIAVVDDLLRIAGIAAVAYVIYGGVRYITSQGSPEGAAQAQATIINGLIGLVIALVAVGIVSFIGSRL